MLINVCPLTVTRFEESRIIDFQRVAGVSSTFIVNGTVTPLSMKEYQNLPHGLLHKGDAIKIIASLEEPRIRCINSGDDLPPDHLSFNGLVYEAYALQQNYFNLLRFVVYYAIPAQTEIQPE